MTPRELIAELQGTACRCGSTKRPKQTFCHTCYYSLSADTRRALYRRVGEGYEEAYDEAIRELEALGRV